MVILRGQKGDHTLDILRFIAASFTCGTPLEVSLEDNEAAKQLFSSGLSELLKIRLESHEAFAKRIGEEGMKRVRMLQTPPPLVLQALAKSACNLHLGRVLANGRLELLHLLREVTISRDYHRYGNLGERENEIRRSLPGYPQESPSNCCKGTRCHE